MRNISSIATMQNLALQWKREGRRIGFVPTMGYLHEGHISLVHRARKLVGKRGRVAVSIYVNPTQFGPKEDLSKYPRDLRRDLQLCRAAGVDTVFAPTDAGMYPHTETAAYSTWVIEEQLSREMEGRSRPTHFRGVTTVVAKLFNIVLPDVAVFGAKDWQQAAIIQRMVHDLNFPLTIDVAPTHRESDGLAMSSRNKNLVGNLRPQAIALWDAIQTAQQRVSTAKQPLSAATLRKQLQRLIEQRPDARVDYIEFFEPSTLRAVTKVSRGAHLALAVFVGTTRLIDNARL
ncbi:MAG: pantoate--beta-alanine ligase [Verrucomicrobia bacterium]|nr:pantoate--beta-alanine ligase [Verrucomicrobiota bacterium]